MACDVNPDASTGRCNLDRKIRRFSARLIVMQMKIDVHRYSFTHVCNEEGNGQGEKIVLVVEETDCEGILENKLSMKGITELTDAR